MRARRLGALALLCVLPLACTPPADGPDVVLVVVDTLRADRLSCYGYPRPTSPNLDRLAAGGARFADVTAQHGWTLPSMSSLLTGRYVPPSRSGIPEDEASLAELFRAAGYETVAVVANKGLVPAAGYGRGFDTYRRINADYPWSPGVRADRVTDLVLETLDATGPRGASRRPLFLWVHYFFPHHPYFRYEALEGELPSDGAPAPAPEGWLEATLTELAGGEPPPEWLEDLEYIEEKRGHYDHEVRYTDLALGRLLDGLEARGFLERAVLALAADHGEGLWDHRTPGARAGPGGNGVEGGDARPRDLLYMKHGAHLYAETVATPLVLSGPGVPAGVVVTDPVENVDLVPTLLELAGLALPSGIDGRSLVAAMHGGGEPRDAVFATARHVASVRETATGLKLVLPGDAPASARHELALFHLPSDPSERVNLADERPDDVARLSARLRRFLSEHELGREEAIDAEQWEVMRGLGYTEADVGGEPAAAER